MRLKSTPKGEILSGRQTVCRRRPAVCAAPQSGGTGISVNLYIDVRGWRGYNHLVCRYSFMFPSPLYVVYYGVYILIRGERLRGKQV